MIGIPLARAARIFVVPESGKLVISAVVLEDTLPVSFPPLWTMMAFSASRLG